MITDVPGVYQEHFIRGGQPCLNMEAVIVTAYAPAKRTKKEGPDVIGCAWRYGSDSEWTFAQGFFESRNLRPHPEADRVWADYCAAVLVNEGAKA